MNSNKIIAIAVALIFGFVGYNAFFKSDDEKEIEAVIQKLQEAITIEAPLQPMNVPRRLKLAQETIIDNFQLTYENDGNTLTYAVSDDTQSKATAAVLTVQKLSVFRTNTHITLRGTFADATFQVAVSGITRHGQIDERLNVKLTLQKNGSRWFIRDASLTELF